MTQRCDNCSEPRNPFHLRRSASVELSPAFQGREQNPLAGLRRVATLEEASAPDVSFVAWNFVLQQELQIFFLESPPSMVFSLLLNVSANRMKLLSHEIG